MDDGEKKYRKNLVDTYKILENYAFFLTHDKDRAKDLLQDTSLKIMNGYTGYQNEGLFTSWAKVIMKNTFLNDVKAADNNGNKIIDGYDYYNDESVHPFVAEDETPYTVYEIMEAINKLPQSQYEVLALRKLGYRYDEIANILSLSVGNVKTRIFLARNSLKNIMKNLQ